jgi:predicted alpha/beta superfamily hydrolase
MKTFTLLFFFGLLLCVGSCNSDKSKESENKIVIGTIDSLHSKILGETRKIWVYVPNSNKIYAKQRYPVVYLLDGDEHFYSVMGIIQQLSEVNGNMILPQMILIGITNTDRTRDLTPSHVTSDGEIDTAFLKTSGGGEKFTSFIEEELIPYVDSLYPTTPYRTLIGHSFGGLMVINSLINHTKLFNSYISIDPSMWWDNKRLLNLARSVLTEKDFTGTSLYLGIANTMDLGLDTNKVKTDTSFATRHIRSILELSRCLKENKKNNLKYDWKYYNNDDHASVPLIAEYNAFRFIFSFYKPDISYSQLKDSSYNIDSVIKKYSETLSDNFGYPSVPPESFVNSLGYNYIGLKQYDRAFRILKMNIEYYPTSSNVYDSMGELLMVRGDTINAIENYEKSLKLDPNNENAKTMIKKMKEKYKGKM